MSLRVTGFVSLLSAGSVVGDMINFCPSSLSIATDDPTQKTLQAGAWGANWDSNGKTKCDSSSLTLSLGGRLYLGQTGPTFADKETFLRLNLLGRTLSFDVEAQNVGCGCNASLYSVAMAGPTSPDNKEWDHYCDASTGTEGHTCVNETCKPCDELDIMETNNASFAVTPHSCQKDITANYSCGSPGFEECAMIDGNPRPGQIAGWDVTTTNDVTCDTSGSTKYNVNQMCESSQKDVNGAPLACNAPGSSTKRFGPTGSVVDTKQKYTVKTTFVASVDQSVDEDDEETRPGDLMYLQTELWQGGKLMLTFHSGMDDVGTAMDADEPVAGLTEYFKSMTNGLKEGHVVALSLWGESDIDPKATGQPMGWLDGTPIKQAPWFEDSNQCATKTACNHDALFTVSNFQIEVQTDCMDGLGQTPFKCPWTAQSMAKTNPLVASSPAVTGKKPVKSVLGKWM